jgi:hypothetical protein
MTWSMLFNQGYVLYNDAPNLNLNIAARYHPARKR